MKSPRNTPAKENTSTKKPLTKADTPDTTKTTTINMSARFIPEIPNWPSTVAKPPHISPVSGEPRLLEAPARAVACCNPRPADSRGQTACQKRAARRPDDNLH